MEAPRPHRPLPIRAINAAGGAAARLGLRLPSLAEDALLEAARKQTGLRDFGQGGFRAGLHQLLASLERDAQLTTIGRSMARGQIGSALANRLQLVEHRKQHPEVGEQRIERPLFVLGLPRTGTTILYGLLAQDPAHRSPLSWEVAAPCPPPRPETYESDPRIARMDAEFDQLRRLAPGFDAIHPMAARLPQECVAITAMDFHSVQFGASYNVPSYEDWLTEQDLRPSYRFHYAFLQHLQSECARERWVLKSPGHLPFIGALLDVYPDAMIVQTHRDPLDVLASVSSLECVLRSAASDAVDPLEIGPQQVDLWSRTLRTGIEQRELATTHANQFFDVHFPELLADPLACVQRIYEHFDLELTKEAEEEMARFLADNARDKHGTHRYSLETFGIDAAVHGRGFDDYCERYGVVRKTR
ncbi:MAG: sulfotransferase [Deltaproteobacteria bacterium]|nr:sulfotransferase [Deltaproteobacteria bacterium]